MLLLDEPTASLDPATALALEGVLDRWLAARTAERALVWVSHDREQTLRMTARRISFLPAVSTRRTELAKAYIDLSYFQVCSAALLIVINGAISVLLKLDLERRLAIAAVCTVVQLLLSALCSTGSFGSTGGTLSWR